MTKELPHIQLKSISKKFPGAAHSIFENISLDIHRGEGFALLGPSGCGKTTLLRIIAGFEEPGSGEVYIDGKLMNGVPPYRRPLNMMFQSYALFPHMTVQKNVEFGLKQENLSASEIKVRVKEGLSLVGLGNLADRYPNQISGGQQQRAALARSLVKKPKLLLLDEPLGALDRKTREATQIELINIQNDLDLTFVIVTHDQEEAMSMADRIGVMDHGRILQIGTPEEVYERPNSRFIADFVGSINFFEGGIVDEVNEGVVVYSKELNVDIKVKASGSLKRKSKIWVAVRPEEIVISSRKPSKKYNQVKGAIIDVSHLGNQIVYHVILSEGEKIVHVSVPASAKAKNPNHTVGSMVYLYWHISDGVILEK
jgi:putrescine transport system ATP-binding protein